ncbi:hypothetical protein BU26DRAFT_605816 [Trematosphaeria pertusa]|uniref:Lytic polysaccharide monooxygenase n=1 Tax=Trematosphaeria pertusa TaxID=390896 RepID=A0A6A6IEK1_9PLEO|nr:uncharacterized protein BU26DRAFT_605816 [Trematosphaeria pertusa]KAF2248332.1 hypothetical protein BU26DRAFT_605816 [Trematosphaeria pertusa]
MPRIRMLLAAGLLALTGVDAKDKIQFSKFLKDTCDDHPLGNLIDLKRNECKTFQAGSIRIHPHSKTKYNKWIDSVNMGKDECFVTLYDAPGCHDSDGHEDISVPRSFEGCTATDEVITSVKFWCRPNSEWSGSAYPLTTTISHTSYSLGADGVAHPSVYSTVAVVSRYSYKNPPPVARGEPTGHPTLEPRKKKQYNVKGVWMKHPWAGSDICYMCWTKKEYDTGAFLCRSGPKYPVDCGPKPAQVPFTSSTTITSTSTFEFFHTTDGFYVSPTTVTTTLSADPSTTTDAVSPVTATTTTSASTITVTADTATTATDAVSKRSPHKPVIVENPYHSGLFVCADAEWEKAGKEKAEVRIQKIKDLDKCRDNPLSINFGRAYATYTAMASTTVTRTVDARPAWALPPF